MLIRDFDDVKRIILVIALVCLPLAVSMLIEYRTGTNLFSVFGGVSEMTMIRDGRLRCQGPFGHPILAGNFAATSIPFLIGFVLAGERFRSIALLGSISATLVVVLSSSSGPIMSYAAGGIWLLMFPLRKNIRIIWYALAVTFVGLQLVMKAPVWFLIGRLGNIMGGTGWARSVLIDEAIKHFGEWWLIGTNYTAHWAADNELITLPNDPNMVDITNQFIFIGVSGGILTLALFVIIIIACFRTIGAVVPRTEGGFSKKIILWSLGAALFSHVTSFVSVAYFDQNIVFWYLLLAIIGSSTKFNDVERNKHGG
jgi:hypothetical protein